MPSSLIKYIIIFSIIFLFSTDDVFPHHQFLQTIVIDFNNQKDTSGAKNKFKPLKDTVYSFADEDANSAMNGRCMKIKYDFSGQGNTESGIWLNLKGIKLLPEQIFLTIFARGDVNDGFSEIVKVKLVAGNKESTHMVRGIRDNWQQFAIPLSDFNQISDFSKLTDLYIIFDNSVITGKKGTVYIDEVAFIN